MSSLVARPILPPEMPTEQCGYRLQAFATGGFSLTRISLAVILVDIYDSRTVAGTPLSKGFFDNHEPGRGMATDIERFIEAEGRQEQVTEIQRRIEAEGIQYLYCPYPRPLIPPTLILLIFIINIIVLRATTTISSYCVLTTIISVANMLLLLLD